MPSSRHPPSLPHSLRRPPDAHRPPHAASARQPPRDNSGIRDQQEVKEPQILILAVHKGEAIGKAIEACLEYWGIDDKLFTVTVDNASSNDVACAHLSRKIVIIELTLTDMHGPEKGMKLAKDVKEFTYSLFEEYRKMYASFNIPQSTHGDCGDNMSMDVDNSIGVRSDYVKKLKERAKRLKGTSGYAISELDRYLNDQLGPEEKEQDALTWWVKNGQRYVILNCMARDILAILLSTVASESAFSTGGRTLDPFRSSLTPKIMHLYLFIL
uniref:HAT C-terminal dimerisation domain-containing protein n=1 Tax=Chenopodium quinoa TaxID=63459 RepID=A0A803MAX5_CHEQI